MGSNNRLLILYGSQTFTAQEVAERIWRTLKVAGFRGPVQPMDEYPISQLIHEEFVLFVCATTGQGDQPDNMKKFWRFLLRRSLPSNSLAKLKFGVIGLGDSSYSKFNFVGKMLHKRLMQLGATPLLDIGLCDYQHDLGHDGVIIPWTNEFYSKLKIYLPNIKIDNLKSHFVPRWNVKLHRADVNEMNGCATKDIYFSNENANTEANLFEVEKNYRTTGEDHFQDVRLITFKTVNDTVLRFKPGDILNIRPRNLQEDIDDLFDIFKVHNIDIQPNDRLIIEECHEDMPVPQHLKNPLTMYEIAEQYWDLRAYATQYVFSLLALVSEDTLERDKCIELSSPEGQEDWLNYCRRPKRTILEVLNDFHKSASKLTLPILFELFSIIKPRSFSIASSNQKSNTSLDLLVAVVDYRTNLKRERLGLCSNWLKRLQVGDHVYAWMKTGTMVFPEDMNTPLIMIGPGTGLAPFRGLIQERVAQNRASKETLHLFFGCRYKHKDYHCKEELEALEGGGKLTLYCAFSRDQGVKIYVQHKVTEYKQTLWELINDKKANIYISGNAKNMPDNVKDAIIEDVFHKTGGYNLDEAKKIVKKLESEGRLQIEAW